MLGKGETLEINGEKTVTRLEVAESMRDKRAERLWQLFTTPVCHKDLVKIQREARPGDRVRRMRFSHHPHHRNRPVPSSFHPHLPPALPSPSPAFASTQTLKGPSQLFPKTSIISEPRSSSLSNPPPRSSFLAVFSCRDGFSLPSLCRLELSSLGCILPEGFTCGLSGIARLALP